MSDPAGPHAESVALEVQLSVPTEGGLRAIAGDLAAKIAEHLGSPSPSAQTICALVDGLATEVCAGRSQTDITFEFRHAPGELVIAARCNGAASEARHPLPA